MLHSSGTNGIERLGRFLALAVELVDPAVVVLAIVSKPAGWVLDDANESLLFFSPMREQLFYQQGVLLCLAQTPLFPCRFRFSK